MLDRPPLAVTFVANRFGRPRLADDRGTGLCFSVSHSGDYALIGLAFRRPIGVDVERARPGTTLAEVAPTICSPAELQEVSRLDPGERTADLYRRWTIKEAYIKALGVGLSGSGPTLFGVFPDRAAAERAGEALRPAAPEWARVARTLASP